MKTAVAAPAPRPSDEEMLEAIEQLTVGDLTRVTRTLYGSLAIRDRFQCVHCGFMSFSLSWSPTLKHWHCADPRLCLKRRGLA